MFAGQTGGSTTFNWTAPASNVGPVTFLPPQGCTRITMARIPAIKHTSTAVSARSPVVIHHGFSDFDGDGKADASVFVRPRYVPDRSTAKARHSVGPAGDRLVPADFDGDDKTDIAVWRADANGCRLLHFSKLDEHVSHRALARPATTRPLWATGMVMARPIRQLTVTRLSGPRATFLSRVAKQSRQS
jgi:hypothetical protein